jgi:hypothetical protein
LEFLGVRVRAAAEERGDGDDTRVDVGQQCPGGKGAAGPEVQEQEGGRHQEVHDEISCVDLMHCTAPHLTHGNRLLRKERFDDLLLQAPQHREHQSPRERRRGERVDVVLGGGAA